MRRRMSKSKALQRKRIGRRKLRRSRLPKTAKVHLFKRQAPSFTISNNVSTQGTVNISDSAQLGVTGTTFEPSVVGGGGLYNFGAVGYFKLSNVLENSDLTNLYDRYKINGIKWKIIPASNFASVNGQGLIPSMVYHVDYDDDATPTTDASVRVKAGAKEVRLDKPHTIFFKPKVASMIAGASIVPGASTGYSVPRVAPYINCSYPGVPHYGLKMFFRNVNLMPGSGSINTQFRIETTYYLSLKDPQ